MMYENTRPNDFAYKVRVRTANGPWRKLARTYADKGDAIDRIMRLLETTNEPITVQLLPVPAKTHTGELVGR